MAKRTKVTTWITHDGLRSLRNLAAHQLTVSRVAADILQCGLKERAETAGLGLLGPAVEGVVKRDLVAGAGGGCSHHFPSSALCRVFPMGRKDKQGSEI